MKSPELIAKDKRNHISIDQSRYLVDISNIAPLDESCIDLSMNNCNNLYRSINIDES